jgi:hypothetical protein
MRRAWYFSNCHNFVENEDVSTETGFVGMQNDEIYYFGLILILN